MTDELERELSRRFESIPAPGARHERALFVEALAARRGGPGHLLAPALGATALLIAIAVAVLSLAAQPGQSLYPVRKALAKVGIAQPPVGLVDRRLNDAETTIDAADDALVDANFPVASRLTNDALEKIGAAASLLPELDGDVRADRADRIADLREDVDKLQADIAEQRIKAVEKKTDRDNSGPGGGDDRASGDDGDNSGPGSDDSGTSSDDSSGSGSGDDSSGPESGDDSSGSGSGDDSSGPESGDDSSGPGSG